MDGTPCIQQIIRSSSLLYPVHRLDRVRVFACHQIKDTSGLLIIAKDRETARALGQEFACGYVEKQYIAIGKKSTDVPPLGLILSDMRRVIFDFWFYLASRLHREFVSSRSYLTSISSTLLVSSSYYGIRGVSCYYRV